MAESGRQREQAFCPECGSPIYSALPTQPDVVYLKTGTLDDTSSFQSQFHVWCDSKQAWVTLDEAVPAIGKQS